MKTKKSILIALVLCVLIIISLVFRILNSEKKNVELQFLNIVFSSNYELRYEKLIEDNYISEQSIKNYYSSLKPYVTDQCLDGLIASRIPITLDSLFYKDGLVANPSNIVLDKYTEDEDSIVYSFNLDLYIQNANSESRIEKHEGQITINKNQNKVSKFYYK